MYYQRATAITIMIMVPIRNLEKTTTVITVRWRRPIDLDKTQPKPWPQKCDHRDAKVNSRAYKYKSKFLHGLKRKV
jgi:hypothetical protein